ncbi:MAG: DUF3391 domain-containing protein [Methylococcaceae bacterium]
MTKKIAVAQLKINMFLCGTDRKWLELPFFRRKFLITSTDQISTLSEYCKFVYIDTEKGEDVIPPEQHTIIEHELSVDPELSTQHIYPVGCAVELNTGELGIVTLVNQQDELRPRLRLLTNAQKQLLTQEQVLDLGDSTKQGLEIIKLMDISDPIIQLLLALYEQVKGEVDEV